MTKDQCISITDLRLNTKKCLSDLNKPKFVFVNNKPVAVILDIDTYEAEYSNYEIKELETSEVTPEIYSAYKTAKLTKKSDLISL